MKEKNSSKQNSVYDFQSVFYRDGIATVGKDGKFGYLRQDGKEITPLKYDKVMPFDWDIGRVCIDGKWGLVDVSGKEITPLIYDEIRQTHNPIVKLNGKYGYLNRETGELLTPVKYDEAHRWIQIWGESDSCDFWENDLAEVRLDGKWGCIDLHGNETVPLKYDEIKISQRGGFHAARLKRKWGFIDRNGKETVPFEYSSVDEFSAGRARVKKKGKYGFIDNSGVSVIPAVYDYCESHFRKDCDKKGIDPVVVKLDGKYGYTDVNGNEIVKPVYEYATSLYFGAGMAAVMLNGKMGFIDRTGRKKIPFIYEPADSPHGEEWMNNYRFLDGFANVKLNGKWGVIDRKNRVIIPFIYDRFLGIRDAGWRCAIRDGKKLSIDTKGVERSVKKNPDARTFRDYLHAATLSETVESGRTLLGLSGKEVKILGIDFDCFSGKAPRTSHDIIRIHTDLYNRKGRKRMPLTVDFYSVKDECSYGYFDWDEALDMEVRIEDGLVLSDAETVAVCIWGACDQWLATEDAIRRFLDGLDSEVDKIEAE
jgi:hypothetical protein